MSEVYFEKDLDKLEQLLFQYPLNHIYILCDSNTANDCLAPFIKKIEYLHDLEMEHSVAGSVAYIIIPAGEGNKNLSKAAQCWEHLLKNKASKNALLINLGGGVVSDLGGFVAANYKRGIDFISIPTSSLAMIDACYGGKTAINFHHYKNQIGSFTHPRAIYIDTTFLETLPERQLNNGFVESVKHHLLFNKNALQEIEQIKNIKEHCTAAWMQQSLAYKKAVVLKDPFDKKERQALNFGHSIGHAIEALAMKKNEDLLHGEAILLGMIEELILAEKYLDCPKEIRDGLLAFKQNMFPELNFTFSKTELLPFLRQDKKNNGLLTFSLIKNVAEPSLFFQLKEEDFLKTYA